MFTSIVSKEDVRDRSEVSVFSVDIHIIQYDGCPSSKVPRMQKSSAKSTVQWMSVNYYFTCFILRIVARMTDQPMQWKNGK